MLYRLHTKRPGLTSWKGCERVTITAISAGTRGTCSEKPAAISIQSSEAEKLPILKIGGTSGEKSATSSLDTTGAPVLGHYWEHLIVIQGVILRPQMATYEKGFMNWSGQS